MRGPAKTPLIGTSPIVPCPSWCVTDHKGGRYEVHWGATTVTKLRVGKPGTTENLAIVRTGQVAEDRGLQQVALQGLVRSSDSCDKDAFLWARPADAREIANLIDLLATATATQHRQVAAALRASADVIGATTGNAAGATP